MGFDISRQLSSAEFAKRVVMVKDQSWSASRKHTYIVLTPLIKPHFYTVKMEFIGVYINFLISAQKHRLWVLIRTAS